MMEETCFPLEAITFWLKRCSNRVPMDKVLKRLPFIWCHIDDVNIFSYRPKKHVKHLQQVFERLQAWGLYLHHGKCKFFHDHLLYLRHMIAPRGLECKK
jgi:hypothetical protein